MRETLDNSPSSYVPHKLSPKWLVYPSCLDTHHTSLDLHLIPYYITPFSCIWFHFWVAGDQLAWLHTYSSCIMSLHPLLPSPPPPPSVISGPSPLFCYIFFGIVTIILRKKWRFLSGEIGVWVARLWLIAFPSCLDVPLPSLVP